MQPLQVLSSGPALGMLAGRAVATRLPLRATSLQGSCGTCVHVHICPVSLWCVVGSRMVDVCVCEGKAETFRTQESGFLQLLDWQVPP